MSSPIPTSLTSLTSTEQSATGSPLERVNPRALDALFNEDPELLSEEETEIIMAALRKDRERFHAEPQSRPKKVTAANLKQKIDAPVNLSLDDLTKDLDL